MHQGLLWFLLIFFWGVKRWILLRQKKDSNLLRGNITGQGCCAAGWHTPASTPHSWQGVDSPCLSLSSASRIPGQARAGAPQIQVLYLTVKIYLSSWQPFRKWELWIFLHGGEVFLRDAEERRDKSCILQPTEQICSAKAFKWSSAIIHNHSLRALGSHNTQLAAGKRNLQFQACWFTLTHRSRMFMHLRTQHS